MYCIFLSIINSCSLTICYIVVDIGNPCRSSIYDFTHLIKKIFALRIFRVTDCLYFVKGFTFSCISLFLAVFFSCILFPNVVFSFYRTYVLFYFFDWRRSHPDENPAKYVTDGKTYDSLRRCKIRCRLHVKRCGPQW